MDMVCAFKKIRLWKISAELHKELTEEQGSEILAKSMDEARPMFLIVTAGDPVVEPIRGINVPAMDKVGQAAAPPAPCSHARASLSQDTPRLLALNVFTTYVRCAAQAITTNLPGGQMDEEDEKKEEDDEEEED